LIIQRTGSFLQLAGTGAGSLIQAGKIEDRFLLTASRNRGRFFNTVQSENPEQVPSYIWQEPRTDSSFEVERLLFKDIGTGRVIILLTVI
jgi:hypothetical protein